jgi:hypothetical protein
MQCKHAQAIIVLEDNKYDEGLDKSHKACVKHKQEYAQIKSLLEPWSSLINQAIRKSSADLLIVPQPPNNWRLPSFAVNP